MAQRFLDRLQTIVVTATLTSAARAAGFTPRSPVIELTGVCTHCRGA
jgi:hypothetical protein